MATTPDRIIVGVPDTFYDAKEVSGQSFDVTEGSNGDTVEVGLFVTIIGVGWAGGLAVEFTDGPQQ